MPLNDLKLRRLKPGQDPLRQSDGGGLFIEVRPNGSKLLRLAYRFEGKQKLLALGSYPETSLARARDKRQDARVLLQNGRDPAAEAQAAKEARRALAEDTFAALAEEVLEKQEREGKSGATLNKKRWLFSLANPDLGKFFATPSLRRAPRLIRHLGSVAHWWCRKSRIGRRSQI
jgi:hypothetical protein